MRTLQRLKTRYIGWLFVIPGLVLYSIVIIGPSLATVRYAFFEWSGLGKAKWVGLKNFVDIYLNDWVFRIALLNNIKYIIIFLTIPMFMGVGIAFIATFIKRGNRFYQTVVYLPVVVASVVTSRIWQWIYHPFFGVSAEMSKFSWFSGLSQFNLGNPEAALYAVAFADIWHWWGFPFVVYYAAIRQIDPRMFEAARMDGAGTWKLFVKITLPLLRPTIMFLYLMHIIWALMSFDYVYIMTRGGPGHASELATTWIFDKAFNQFEAGYACALAVYLTLTCILFVSLYAFMKKKGWETY